MTVYRNRWTTYYRCRTHADKRTTGTPCHPNYIQISTLLEALQQLLERLRDPAILQQLLQDGTDRGQLQRDRAALEARIQPIQKKRERLALAFSDGTMQPDIYRAADDHLLEDLAGLVRRRDHLAGRLATLPSAADLRANIQHILAQTHLDPNWLRNAPPLQTRTALYNAGIRIYVLQNHITRITISPD